MIIRKIPEMLGESAETPSWGTSGKNCRRIIIIEVEKRGQNENGDSERRV